MKQEKSAFRELLSQVQPHNRIFVELSISIAKQVKKLLDEHPTIKTTKDLADKVKMEEEAVENYLSGLHNIDIDIISRFQAALDTRIILTLSESQSQLESVLLYQHNIASNINDAIHSFNGHRYYRIFVLQIEPDEYSSLQPVHGLQMWTLPNTNKRSSNLPVIRLSERKNISYYNKPRIEFKIEVEDKEQLFSKKSIASWS